MKHLGAHTAITYDRFPAYVSINETDDGRVSITVRATGMMSPVTMELSREDAITLLRTSLERLAK